MKLMLAHHAPLFLRAPSPVQADRPQDGRRGRSLDARGRSMVDHEIVDAEHEAPVPTARPS